MAKFSRFDPRNKKDGRHKKQVLEGKGKKKPTKAVGDQSEKYLKKYKKFIETEFQDVVT